MQEKKNKSQSYENKKEIIKKYRTNLKEKRKVTIEITGAEESVKDDFKHLVTFCDVTKAELLKAMVRYCDNTQFKRYVIDKEYLEKKPEVFII